MYMYHDVLVCMGCMEVYTARTTRHKWCTVHHAVIRFYESCTLRLRATSYCDVSDNDVSDDDVFDGDGFDDSATRVYGATM